MILASDNHVQILQDIMLVFHRLFWNLI